MGVAHWVQIDLDELCDVIGKHTVDQRTEHHAGAQMYAPFAKAVARCSRRQTAHADGRAMPTDTPCVPADIPCMLTDVACMPADSAWRMDGREGTLEAMSPQDREAML